MKVSDVEAAREPSADLMKMALRLRLAPASNP
jgi:hypothetical protein